MRDNLFSALSKYKPRESRSPEEDFLTEAFAWLLRNNPVIRHRFLAQVLGAEWNIDPLAEAQAPCRVSTQRVLRSGKRVDLVIEIPNVLLMYIESKVEAGLGIYEEAEFGAVPQLKFYKDDLENEGHRYRKLVLISKAPSSHFRKEFLDEYVDQHLRWQDVCKLLENTIRMREQISSVDSWCLTEFKRYLEEVGMGGARVFSKNDREALFRHRPALKACEELMERVVQDITQGFNLRRKEPVNDTSVESGSQFRKGEFAVWGHYVRNDLLTTVYPCLWVNPNGECRACLHLSADSIADSEVRKRVSNLVGFEPSPFGGKYLVRGVPDQFFRCVDAEEQAGLLIEIYRDILTALHGAGAVHRAP